MKKNIHPSYGQAVIRCACGNVVETQATTPEIKVDICSGCHPFYTGKKKIVDATGRVDRFLKRFKKSEGLKQTTKTASPEKSQSPAEIKSALKSKA
jgi:large subunit ribosomal protein L31